MVNVQSIIQKYCRGNERLEQVLLKHSTDVAQRALRIARAHPELGADETFLWEAAMLHDIGITRVDAPSIYCFGTEPYIRHGILGAEILRSEGLPRHARVAERHTGTGLTAEEIIRQNLPLPHQDFTPESIEEQIVCYADKFYSKTRLDEEKTPEQAMRSLEKFGSDGIAVFKAWMARFS
ncbi:MAG: HDIG domain-containing protein [Bacteroidaceae bacterium]|nr:HDIG domain-containing protein [Bacteroidaceae bacterium]